MRGWKMGGWASMDFSGQGIEWSQLPPSGLDHEISSFSFVSLGGAPRMLTGLEGSLNPRPLGRPSRCGIQTLHPSPHCLVQYVSLCLSDSIPQPGG